MMKTLLLTVVLGVVVVSAKSAHAEDAIREDVIHLEAENGQLSGTTVATTRAGFSGAGYVSGFLADADTVSWVIPRAKAGIYQVALRYSADNPKGFGVVVNGARAEGMFAATGGQFATQTAGKVELKDGENTVSIAKGWGHYDIDFIELSSASNLAVLPKPPATLVDAKATAPARALMELLVRNYGEKTLSGQYDPGDTAYVREVTGQTPAILGADFMDYSPSRVAHGSKNKPPTEEIIALAKAGQIVTLSWHWNAPSHLIDAPYIDKNGQISTAFWWRGFYTDATTFDLEKTLNNPNSADYKLLLRDIDALAVQLKKLDAAGVPVLWRPLHEADGTWFWWGAKGEEPFKKLWRLMFERLTQTHDLHNLIWVYTGSPEKPEWYPGDDVVDIYGVDSYPADRNDTLSSSWEALRAQFDGKKLLTLSEFKGVPDAVKMKRFGVNWSYFVAWTGDSGPRTQPAADVKRTYNAPNVVNAKDLPR
ncbi:glycosyl hydrolase [Abditibacterium utsteinense]|nr:glycosyl hydrolase [Abditibacterium utsteinense]